MLRIASGALLVVCIATPGPGAAVSTKTVAEPVASAPAAVPTGAPFRGRHFVNTIRGLVSVTGPSGCSASGSLSFTGGGSGNTPGGYAAGILAGGNNSACDSYSAIGGGQSNTVGGDGNSYDAAILGGIADAVNNSAGAFIGGGLNNTIGALPPYGNSNLSAIAAGYLNVVGSPDSFIGSGESNSIIPPSTKLANNQTPSAFIGAGYGNSISSDFAVIDGGYGNSVTGEYGAVGGGYNNAASGFQATVTGGYGNAASGRNAVVSGGAYNTAAGLDTFAAGNNAKALYDGTFVWSDYSAASGVASTAPNQFVARAAGGFYLYSSSNARSGVRLAPGSGSWSNLSDRAEKTSIESVDDAGILAKVAAMPVEEWSYTGQGTSVRHLGPMAQDFRAAFGLGEDDKHISTVDEDGVAFASIKALQAEVVEKDRKISNLDAKYAQLERRLDALERTASGKVH